MILHEFILLNLLLACAITTALGQVHHVKLSKGLDPTIMVVVWSTTNSNVVNSQIMYGTSQTSLSMLAYGEKENSNTYQSFNFEKERGSNTDVTLTRHASSVIYTVRLKNLAPGTIYYYRCGDSASPSLSPILSFATLPAADFTTDSKGSSMVSAIPVEKNVSSAILTTAATSPYDIAVVIQNIKFD